MGRVVGIKQVLHHASLGINQSKGRRWSLMSSEFAQSLLLWVAMQLPNQSSNGLSAWCASSQPFLGKSDGLFSQLSSAL